MKKILNIILCLGMIIQDFAFIPVVFAEEIMNNNEVEEVEFGKDIISDKETEEIIPEKKEIATEITSYKAPGEQESNPIAINRIIQNGNTLAFEDDAYIANSYNEFSVYLDIPNYESTNSYYIRLYRDDMYKDYYSLVVENNDLYFPFNEWSMPPKVANYYIELCDTYNCDNINYGRVDFTINYAKYDEMSDDIIYFTSITQGNQSIAPDEYGYINLNNRQKITFNIKGENLTDDKYYEIRIGGGLQYNYLGSALEEGISIAYYQDGSSNFIDNEYKYEGLTRYMCYDTGVNCVDVWFNLTDAYNLPDYTSKLKYTTDLDKVIYVSRINDTKHYLIDTNYDSGSKFLTYNIVGTNYLDIDYEVQVKVTNGDNVIYTKNVNVNGLLLNNGYNLELDGLTISNYNATYNFEIIIDDASQKIKIKFYDTYYEIFNIKQGDVTLEKENGIYQATEASDLKVAIVSNEEYNDYHTAITYSSDNYSNAYMYSNNVYVSSRYYRETEDMVLCICDNSNCDRIYGVTTFKVKYTNYDKIVNGKVYFESIEQGNKSIAMNEYSTLTFNDKEYVTFNIKGDNLIANATYNISFPHGNGVPYEEISYLGSELEDGIEYVYIPNGIFSYMYINYDINRSYYNNVKYKNNDDYYEATMTVESDASVADYTGSLLYSDLTEVELYSNNGNSYYSINKDKYTNGNLVYRINGNGYLDEDYNVSIKLKNSNSELKNIDVNGLLLNNGYDLELNNLNLVSGETNIYIVKIENVIKELTINYSDKDIIIRSIRQGDTSLNTENGIYIANDLRRLAVSFNMSDFDNEYYYANVKLNDSLCASSYYLNDQVIEIIIEPNSYNLDNGSNVKEYTLNICTDSWSCNNIVASTKFKVRYDKLATVKDGNIYFESIYQGGNLITVDNNYYIKLNNKQAITFNIRGNNLVNNETYKLKIGEYNNTVEYLGSNLSEGVTYTYYPSGSNDTFFANTFCIDDYCKYLSYYVNGIYENYNYTMYNDYLLSDYNATLEYTDYKDVEISKYCEYNANICHYTLDNNYYNANNTLSYKITGESFQDKNYLVQINITNNGNVIKTKEENVNGLLLNAGYDLELDNLLLDNNNTYNFDITIDGIRKSSIVNTTSKSINIIKIVEGNNELSYENGEYISNTMKRLRVHYSIDNYDSSTDRYIVVYRGNDRTDYEINNDKIFYLGIGNSELDEYTINVCNDWSCSIAYATKKIKVRRTKYSQYENGNIYFESITQGGKEAELDEYNHIRLNDKQKITFRIKGTNLIEDDLYMINVGYYNYNSPEYTGRELMDGIDIEIIDIKNESIYHDYRYDDCYRGIDLYDGINYININGINIVHDDTIPSYDATLKYTDYSEIAVVEKEVHYNNKTYHLIDKKYHTSTNTLSYLINGNNFQDENYTININVKYGNSTVYSISRLVNGLSLNNGYTMALDGLYVDKINGEYTIDITINDVLIRNNLKLIEGTIGIKGIRQYDNFLEIEDGMYQASGLYDYYIYPDTDEYTKKYKNLVCMIDYSNGYTSSDCTSAYLNLNLDNEINDYDLYICKDYDCSEMYAYTSFKIKNSHYDEINDSEIIITNITQGGNKIVPSYYGTINVNNRQAISLNIKGKNLISDKVYTINNGNYQDVRTYLGSELNNGINYTYNPNNNYGFYLECKVDGYNYHITYDDGEIMKPSIYFSVTEDDSIPDFKENIIYTNSNEEIFKTRFYTNGYINYYLVDQNILNNDTLTYVVDGMNYEDKNYIIHIEATQDGSLIYSEDKAVNGLLLNDNYEISMSNIHMVNIDATYEIKVMINDITNNVKLRYITKDILVKEIKQSGKTLEKVNGIYQANDFGYINFYTNTTSSDRIRYQVVYKNDYNLYSMEGVPIDLMTDEVTDFYVIACNNWSCDKIYGYAPVKIKLVNYNHLNDGKVYITDVYQNGNKIEMDSNHSLNVNNKQNVTFKLKGTNLFSDKKYHVSMDDGYYYVTSEYLGSELAEGIDITYHMINTNYFSRPSISLENLYIDLYYYDGNEYYNNFSFNLRDTDIDETYEASLEYTNYPDKEIVFTDNWNQAYILNSKYFNTNNTLSYVIKGNNYTDKLYKVLAEVRYNGKNIYSKTFNINGLLLNNEYKLELTDFTLSLHQDEEYNEEPTYEMYLSIDEVSTVTNIMYNSIGKEVSLSSEIFFENGKKNLSAFRGFGHSGIYDTNNDAFNKYEHIYINYLGKNFLEDETYEYVLEYGYYDSMENMQFPHLLKTGEINGKELNELGLFFELDNNDDYAHPTYRLTIKKDDEIITWCSPVLYLTDMAVLGNVSLRANNKDLYLRMDDYEYVAVRNAPIDIEVSGLGFDDNRDYQFTFGYYEITNQGMSNDISKTIILNGHDINNGTAVIHFENESVDTIKGYQIYIASDDDNFSQGYFEINFVDSKELFPEVNKYVIGDAGELIKNIHKNTTADEFKENIVVANGGTIKIFDKLGLTEVFGRIGTGMIGRILDAYNRSILDMDIIVKGDTTGDGNITITDLVKVKKHLTDMSYLLGVYEIAGDVTDTGSVDITDLVQMSQDVAGIKEID